MADGRPAQAGASRGERLDRAIQGLLGQSADVLAAAVVSFDGLPMASALPGGMDEDRVAAMSAALLSLGERAAQGLGRGELSQVYIEGEEGTVFLVSCDNEAVLVAVGARHAKVGLVLFEVRRAAAQVADALRDELPEDVDEPADEPLVSEAPATESAEVPGAAELAPAADETPAEEPVPAEPFYVPAPTPNGWDVPAAATAAPAEAEPAEPALTPEPRHATAPAYVSYAPSGSVLPGEPPRWS